MKKTISLLFIILISFCFCSKNKHSATEASPKQADSLTIEAEVIINDTVYPKDIIIEKDFLYDKYTLEDVYPYKDTTRVFQWEKIREQLAHLETLQKTHTGWAILQNYKNRNGVSSIVKNSRRNSYGNIADSLGVERYQSVALYLLTDTIEAERYGRDGSLVKLHGEVDSTGFIKIENVNFEGEWLVRKKYLKNINDTVVFKKAIFIDVTNQNIATLEKSDSIWYVRSMNPATTGRHRPPYAYETPSGIFVIQEKKVKMVYLKDGSPEVDGYAPYANRFTNGAYVHGIPVKLPRTEMIEYSYSLGTTPRSHMCVRNATSHSKFIFNWAPTEETIVFVIE